MPCRSTAFSRSCGATDRVDKATSRPRTAGNPYRSQCEKCRTKIDQSVFGSRTGRLRTSMCFPECPQRRTEARHAGSSAPLEVFVRRSPVYVEPPSWAGIRKPSQKRRFDCQPMTFRSTPINGHTESPSARLKKCHFRPHATQLATSFDHLVGAHRRGLLASRASWYEGSQESR
jgi:hypothetical protein